MCCRACRRVEREKMNKTMYYKMYQSINNIPGPSVIIKADQLMGEINAAKDSGIEMPVFEPVFMAETEFGNLPEFDGF